MKKLGPGLLPLSLILVCFLGASLSAQFIGLDDSFHLLNNSELRSGHWWYFWTSEYFSTYIPVVYSIWTLVFQWSQSPQVFHLINLAIHSLNVFLLWRWLSREQKTQSWAWAFAVCFFAIHPLQTETIMWVSGLRDLLAAFFALLVLYFWKFGRPSTRSLFVILFFALSLFSKPGLVLLPFLLWISKPQNRSRPKFLWPMLIGLSIAITGFTFLLQRQTSSLSSGMKWSLYRIPIFFDSIGFYFLKLIWPFHLSIDYGHSLQLFLERGVDPIRFFLGVIIVTFAIGFWKKMDPQLRLGLVWVFLFFLPTSGLVPFGFEEISVHADRYFYFSLVGVSIISGNLMGQISKTKYLLALIPILIGLTMISYSRAQKWIDDEKLMSETLKVNSQSKIAHLALAVDFAKKNQADKAIAHYRRALEFKPQDFFACSGLVKVLVDSQQNQEADAILKSCFHDEERIREFQGTVQLSALYAACGYFYFKALRDLGQSHRYFCESLKHHQDNQFARMELAFVEEEAKMTNKVLQTCR